MAYWLTAISLNPFQCRFRAGAVTVIWLFQAQEIWQTTYYQYPNTCSDSKVITCPEMLILFLLNVNINSMTASGSQWVFKSESQMDKVKKMYTMHILLSHLHIFHIFVIFQPLHIFLKSTVIADVAYVTSIHIENEAEIRSRIKLCTRGRDTYMLISRNLQWVLLTHMRQYCLSFW